jgi:hypothetical protein
MIIRVREKQGGGNTFRRGQQGFEMTTDCITADSAKPMTFLDVEQQLEDLLAMERIMHHQAWIAVNEDWIAEPAQALESILFAATNIWDRTEKLSRTLRESLRAERV